MLHISVNIGTYSIKFLNFTIERKKVVYHSSKEVVIDSDEFNVMEQDVVTDLQMNIISQYLEDIHKDYKLILNVPSEMMANRFLDIPVKNKKKATLMIPFMLEEDIPFSLSEAHFASSVHVTKSAASALVNLCREEFFSPFFTKIKEYKIQPKLLTSEISAIDNYVRNTKEILPQSFCILDIGHTTAKGYFFLDRELKSTQTSYTAGYSVNEAICDAYSITSEEAALYKHQNCFFLTQDQYEKVSEPQRIFAQLMEKTFEPLINDFKRWNVSFRVQNGLAISEIFVIGGSSNIKNAANFLTEQLGIKVSTLNTFSDTNDEAIDNDEKQRRKFSMANMMAQTYSFKSHVVNFLHGNFSIQGHMDLPLHSFAFIGTRISALVAIFFFSFLLERIFINRDLTQADIKLKALVKNPILNINPRDQRGIDKNPQPVLTKLNKENKMIVQEIKTLQASIQTNALKSLEMIHQMLTGFDVEILQFQSVSGGDFTLMLEAKDALTITQLDEAFKQSDIKNLFTEKNVAKRTFTISGSGE